MRYQDYIVTTKLEDSPAVYMILNLIEDKVYIGSTKNVRIRYKLHINKLKQEKHINKKLSKAFNDFGANAFICGVIKYGTIEESRKLEQYYINLFDAKNKGYNITNTVFTSNDDDVKKKISINARGEKNSQSKTTNEEVEIIIGYLSEGWLSCSLSKKLNISCGIIKTIKTNRNRYLHKIYPEEYRKIKNYLGCRSTTSPEEIKKVLRIKIKDSNTLNKIIAQKMGWPNRSRVDDILKLNQNYYKMLCENNSEIRKLYNQL